MAYAATNIDDIFILMILYAQAEDRRGTMSVAAGQFLGLGILTAVSWLHWELSCFLLNMFICSASSLWLLESGLCLSGTGKRRKEKRNIMPADRSVLYRLPLSLLQTEPTILAYIFRCSVSIPFLIFC